MAAARYGLAAGQVSKLFRHADGRQRVLPGGLRVKRQPGLWSLDMHREAGRQAGRREHRPWQAGRPGADSPPHLQQEGGEVWAKALPLFRILRGREVEAAGSALRSARGRRTQREHDKQAGMLGWPAETAGSRAGSQPPCCRV